MVLSVSFAWTVYRTVSQAARVAAAGSRVAVAGGNGVGVGRGTFIFCPIARLVQVLFRLFMEMMAATDELYKLAMAPQLSPAWTVYSMGGSGVNVGVSVGIRVSVGVAVDVGVVVRLGMGVGGWIW